MKHFGVYRKLILIAGTVIAAVSVGSVFFMENTSALNARTAAEAIRQREFDLVLLDIK